MSQVTPFDFVYALILGGIIEEGLYDTETKIYHVLYAAALWAILIYTVEKLTQKFEKLRPAFKGKTTILINDGEVDIEELGNAKLEMAQLRTMLRMQGIFSLSEVKYAFLEVNGRLSVMKYSEDQAVTANTMGIDASDTDPSVLLIDEGKIHQKNLDEIDKDKNWLEKQLNDKGIKKVKDVFYAEWDKQRGFYITTYGGETYFT